MSRESTLILLGILVGLTPFLGIPRPWLSWILPVLALGIVFIGIAFRARRDRAYIDAMAPRTLLHDEAPTT